LSWRYTKNTSGSGNRLTVSNRVLQHIVDEAEFTKVLRYLASLTRYFYVNEAGMEASWHNPHLKGRDYIEIFRGLGWRVAEQGGLTAEDGTRQRWMLFADYQKIDKAMPFEIGTAERRKLGVTFRRESTR
jgi:hypothetical protein